MKTLRNLEIAGGLLLGGTGVPAAVGDQVTLYLDTDANGDFPESIVGVIQHPIASTQCGSYVSYAVEYDEADLAGAALLLRPQDVIDTVLITQGDVLSAALLVETAARIAADALKANIASPTFTGIVVLPSTTSVGTVSGTEIGYLDGVTSAIQTQLGLKAPLASPTFTGTVTIPGIVAPIVGITGSKAQFDTAATDGNFGWLNGDNVWTATNEFTNPVDFNSDVAFAGNIVIDPITVTSFQAALFLTPGTNIVAFNGVLGSAQALTGAGAVNVTTLTTCLTTTGIAQALTLADGTNGQIKTIIHDVDGGSAVLTPATKTGYTTITFTGVGETATLQFVTTRGWMILSLRGAVAA